MKNVSMWLAVLLSVSVAEASDRQGLEMVAKSLTSVPVLRGQFVQEKTVAGFKKPLVSSGAFVLAKDAGFIWNTKKPFASTLTLTASSLRAVDGEGKTTYAMDSEKEPGLAAVNGLLLSMLAGDFATLEKSFTVKPAKASGKDAWSVLLTPKPGPLSRAFERITLSGDAYVRDVRFKEDNGDESHIVFSAQEKDESLREPEKKLLQPAAR